MKDKTKKTIRILYVLNDASGGASMSAYQFIKSLPKDQVELYAVCYPSGRQEDLDRFRQLCSGLRVVYMPWCTLPLDEPLWMQLLIRIKRLVHSGFHILPVLKIIRLIRQWKIDVVHSNTIVQWDAATAAYFTNTRHIWHVRELFGDNHPHHFSLPPHIVKLLLGKTADCLIANSNITAACIKENSPPEIEKKIKIVPNPLLTEKFSTSDSVRRGQKLRIKWGIGEEHILIGMCAAVGTFWKRHDWFIEAAGQIHDSMPDARFVICGILPEYEKSGWEYYQQLLSKIESLNMASKFKFTGHINDVPGMMRALDIMVHTSPDESFGRVVLEAMAASKPVIGFNSGGVGELVLHGETGMLAETGDIEALASCIKILAKDRSLRENYGQKGQMVAEQNYSMGNFTINLMKIYNNIVRVNGH